MAANYSTSVGALLDGAATLTMTSPTRTTGGDYIFVRFPNDLKKMHPPQATNATFNHWKTVIQAGGLSPFLFKFNNATKKETPYVPGDNDKAAVDWVTA